MHRIRERLVKNRSALVNQIRRLLAENGVVIEQGINHIRKKLPEIIEDMTNELSDLGRELFNDLLIQFYEADNRVEEYDARVDRMAKQNEICQRLMTIKGVGALTGIVPT